MKILLQNYTSILTTEPMYLDECFRRSEAINSSIWNENASSAFDALDLYQPNVLICHYTSKSLNDVIKYLSGNSKIELLVNITGAQNSHIKILEDILDKNSVSCPMFISNLHEKVLSPKSQRKILNLLPGVDVFLPKQNLPEFSLDAAILSNIVDLSKKSEKGLTTYHKIGFGVQDNYFDFNVNVSNMSSLYDKYNRIIIASDIQSLFSQFFFDAVFKAKKVTLKTDDDKKMSEILSSLFEPSEDDEDIASSIKTQIKIKHTCFNRAERLARALKCENAAKIIKTLGEKV